MTTTNDLLLEIGTEELPAHALTKLITALANELKAGLQKKQLIVNELHTYVTPRRLAVVIKDLPNQQPEQIIEKRGPALEAAYDKNGDPTHATLGFAKSCNIMVEQLKKISTDKGTWLLYQQKKPGIAIDKLIPEIVTHALKSLPMPKAMRWGNGNIEFVRPIHWLTLLYGSKLIKTEIFGIKTGKYTYGHRFHHPKKITLTNPAQYADILQKQGFVIADFTKRKLLILDQIEKIAAEKNGQALIDENLLNEVTGLVEWPIALLGDFPTHFLNLPREALISSMQKHQRCFPLCDKNNNLLPHFITISNIESKNTKSVITGNERVINARLTDAKFFYETDLNKPLENNLAQLKNTIFQIKLGSEYNKTLRIAKLAEYIAEQLQTDSTEAKRAALLAKTDLVTEMVREFPELQGIMGYYYAKYQQEPEAVAIALKEQYLPRFAGDILPKTTIGQIIAIADRIDTLVGIFGINEAPTGDKDPFGLRRAALGILRIIIENSLALDLKNLVAKAMYNYQDVIDNKWLTDEKIILDFLFERLRAWYLDKNITPQVFAAVLARFPTEPTDFDLRIHAVSNFQKLPEAETLATANKRVSNILKKANLSGNELKVDQAFLQEKEEIELAKEIAKQEQLIKPLCIKRDYSKVLVSLALLKTPVDKFFDKVMVMTDDKKLQLNRLALLNKLRDLFLHVADISLLY